VNSAGHLKSTEGQEEGIPAQPVAFGIAVIAILMHLLTAARYGYFRDELYYLDCARHLAWGYVDQPPLIAFVAWFVRHTTGDSLYSLRLLPAVAAGATVWLAGRLARALGAHGFGQGIAALAVLIAPGYLIFFHLLTMNAFEPLLWTANAFLLVRIIQSGKQKLWLWFGVLSGVGILNKWTMLLFGFGVVVGLVLTRERRQFSSRWIWLGFSVCMMIWLPNIVWNFRHHWPFFELMRNLHSSGRDVRLGPLTFLADQALFMNVLTVPVWIAGAWWFFFGKEGTGRNRRARYRVLGWTYFFLLILFVAAKGKSYYLWPIYPMLFAAGGVAIEQWTSKNRVLRPLYAFALALSGFLFSPFALPVLSPETLVRYQRALHFTIPEVEHQQTGPLGQQVYADMFGWEEMAREVSRAYFSLPTDVRSKTAIVGHNFGEAGALDFFGPKYGLPGAISGHQSYWLWGPGEYTGESILLVGDSADRARELCNNVDVAGRVEHPYSRGDEHFNIYWCHPLKESLQKLWPSAKHFD
jgi:hypothetical protein